jgi:zinc transport system substrate-binding protein
MKSRTKSLKTPGKVGCLNYRLLLMAVLYLLALVATPATASPQVAASIKPLQLIAAAITDGVSEAQLVLGNNQDPHHASLRPSDRKILAQADVVLWIGPMLELPLVEPIGDISGKVLAVQDMDHIILHDLDGNLDPHVWLDTRNARQVARGLAQTLQLLDPANGPRYETNLQNFQAALDTLDSSITQDFALLKSQPWTVYHNAFRYFADQFDLTAPLAPVEGANNQAGIRSILALLDNIQQQQITCMLIEPDMNQGELQSLLGAASLHIVTADVMGYPLEPDADAYPVLIQNFASTLAGCLHNSPAL